MIDKLIQGLQLLKSDEVEVTTLQPNTICVSTMNEISGSVEQKLINLGWEYDTVSMDEWSFIID